MLPLTGRGLRREIAGRLYISPKNADHPRRCNMQRHLSFGPDRLSAWTEVPVNGVAARTMETVTNNNRAIGGTTLCTDESGAGGSSDPMTTIACE